MSVVTVSPYPSLGVVAREARSRARAEKRQKSRPLGAIRRVLATFAIVFALVGIGGGTAQAWPWDVGDQITAFITNFCGPEDVPVQNQYYGVDNVLGLNNPDSSQVRGTVIPNTGGAGSGGNWAERMSAAYGQNATVAKPSYERYGFSTLRWTSYGSGCFSVAFWFNPISNFALNLFVSYPMIIGMAILKFALGNPLYTAFAAIISPFVKVFTAIFTPWIYFIAPIGVFWAWMRSKGSVQETLKAAVWVISIFGVFAWMGNNTSMVVTRANNFVTVFATSAASKISEVQGGPQASYGTDDPTAGINQALWHGVPYQTWLLGEVGPDQAKVDAAREKAGEVGMGPAILNSLYVGNDGGGRNVILKTLKWNGLSYAPNGDDTKTDAWTSNGGKDSWASIPFLYTVKIICNDTEDGGSSSGDADKNKWMYGGSCDPSGAGTTSMLPYFQGKAYDAQLVTAFSGGFAAFAVVLAIIAASFYLAIQKMIFYFMLLFAPVFLAISTFADPKRRRFATRYFEVLAANIIKQCVAVCGVLFIANAMSTLLYPPPELNIPDIPWMLKPVAAMLFFIALVLFVFPLMSIVKAAAKGDTSVIDKTAQAPMQAAKLTGKAAVIGGAALATGGFGAGAAANALGGGKAASMLTSAGRLMGSRGGVGKLLTTAGRGLHMRDQVSGALAQRQGTTAARQAGVQAMLQGTSGQAYMAKMAKTPGMVDADGKLTKAGQKRAEKDFMATVVSGVTANRAAALQDAHMKQFFAGHRAQNNGQFHPLDPANPEMRKAAAVEAAKQRLAAQEEANHVRKREGAASGTQTAAAAATTTAPNPSEGEVKQTAKASSQAGFAASAREKVDGPAFAKDENIKPSVVANGNQVLAEAGISRAEAAANPTLLLTGKAYNGGDTATMNPLHPATASLNELRFAMANGSEQDIQAAAAKASEAIVLNGVPDQVAAVTSTGATAAAFQTADVVGPMPNVTASTTWQERAEAATTMQAAASTIPADNPAGQVVRDYVSALSNPAVSAGDVEALKVQAIKALDDNVVATEGAVQESLFNPAANPAAEGMGASGRFVASAPSGDLTNAPMAGAAAAGVATVERPMDVNGVMVTSNSPLAQIDRAVETLDEGHPARASYAQYVQTLENTNATDEQVEGARAAVLSDLGAVSAASAAASQPTLFDAPTATGGAGESVAAPVATGGGEQPRVEAPAVANDAPAMSTPVVAAATAPIPDGFRETSVPTQDGSTVRGIEPMASGAAVSAPEGYAAQTVTAEDGTSREVFVPSAAAPAAMPATGAATGTTATSESYDQPALFDMPAQGGSVQSASASAGEAPRFEGQSAGEAPRFEGQSDTTAAATPVPQAAPVAAATTLDMASQRDDISQAVASMPADHPARESFARHEEVASADSSMPSSEVNSARHAVLNDLGVTPESGPVAFAGASQADQASADYASTPDVSGASASVRGDASVSSADTFGAGTSEAPSFSPTTGGSTESYDQPALFDLPSQGGASQPMVADATPVSDAPTPSFGADTPSTSVDSDHGDAMVAGAAGLAAGAAFSGGDDRSHADQGSGSSYDQPALFDVPQQDVATSQATSPTQTGASAQGDSSAYADTEAPFRTDAPAFAGSATSEPYEQPALFDAPAPSADLATAPAQVDGYTSTPEADHGEADHGDAFMAGATGLAAGAALSGGQDHQSDDRQTEQSYDQASPSYEQSGTSNEQATSYDQPALFDMPSASQTMDAPVAATVDMDASHDDLARAVQTLPEGHAARESFAAYEAAQDGPAFAAETPEDLRQTVLNDLGVSEATGPVSFTEAPSAGYVGMGGNSDADRDQGPQASAFEADTYSEAPAAGYTGETAQQADAPAPSFAGESFATDAPEAGYVGMNEVGEAGQPHQDTSFAAEAPYGDTTHQDAQRPEAYGDVYSAGYSNEVPEAGYTGMTSDGYTPDASQQVQQSEGYADTSFAQDLSTDAPEAGYVGVGGFAQSDSYAPDTQVQADDSGWSADSGHDDRGGSAFFASAPTVEATEQPAEEQAAYEEPISQGPSFDPAVGNSDYYVSSNDHGYGRSDGPAWAAPDEVQQAEDNGWREDVAPAGYVGIDGSDDGFREQPTVVVSQESGYRDDYQDHDDHSSHHDGTPLTATIDRDSLRDAMRELHDEEQRMRPVDAPAPFEVASYDESPRYHDQGGQQTFQDQGGYSDRALQDQGGFSDHTPQQEFTAPQESASHGTRFERPEVSSPVAPAAPEDVAPVEEAADQQPLPHPTDGPVQEYRRSKKRRFSGLFGTDEDGNETTDERG